jgi:Phosphotransferase enzyme family
MKKVNISALARIATRLRQGIACKVPALDALERESPKAAEMIMDQMGGQNCHVDVVFDDGVTWLARFRLVNDPTLPPPPIANHIFVSEVATMYDLAKTKVRAPEIFHYSKNDKDNQVGLAFFLMEKLSGRMLDWNSASKAQKSKIMEQLADTYLEIERHPYQALG